MNRQDEAVRASLALLLAGAAILPITAFAQTAEPSSVAVSSGAVTPTAATVDESGDAPIVVTAQRRAEAQVDVPITVTTLSTAQLSTANVQQLIDIAKITPALRFDRQSQFVQPTIRGIGTGITTAGGGSNVGIYIDGFYSPNPAAADFQILNVKSIQVLKGPQGTLFGRNTTGGAILVQTSDPSTTTRVEGDVRFGRYNELNAQGYATVGLTDRIALDIGAGYQRGSGWVRDLSNGDRDGDYRNWSVRFGLKADLTDDVSVLLRYQHNKVNDQRSEVTNTYFDPVLGATAPNFAPPGTFTTDRNAYTPGANQRYFHSKQDIAQLTIKADLGFADLASYSQYRQEKADTSEDLDHTALTIFQLGLPVIDRTYTQEFLLTSKAGPRLQWTAGLFFLKNTDRYITFIDNGFTTTGARLRLGGSSAPTYSYAAFVDGTYEVTPRFFVTAGLRYAHDEIKDSYWNTRFLSNAPITLVGGKVCVPVDGKVFIDSCQSYASRFAKDDRVTPRVVLRFKPTDRSSIYASYTKGYKAAIIDVGGSCQNAPYTCSAVKPETINAFEVGYKYDSRKLSFETAAYYYDYKNLQVSLFLQGTAAIINAASSRIYGLEGSVRYAVTPQFEVSAGANYNHGRYTNFPNAPIYRRCPTVAGCGSGTSFYIDSTVTLKDVHMQRSPDFTGNIGASYKVPLGSGQLALSGNLYYTSKIFFGPSGVQFPQKGYETLALRAQWTAPGDRFSLALYGDNVTNSRYVTQVQYNNFGIGSTWSEPVTYGVEAGFKF